MIRSNKENPIFRNSISASRGKRSNCLHELLNDRLSHTPTEPRTPVTFCKSDTCESHASRSAKLNGVRTKVSTSYTFGKSQCLNLRLMDRCTPVILLIILSLIQPAPAAKLHSYNFRHEHRLAIRVLYQTEVRNVTKFEN